MKRYITRVIFVIFCAAIVLLPLLPRAETEGEYTYAKALYYEYGEVSDDAYEMTFFTPEGEICRLPMGKGSFYIDMALDRSYAFAILNLTEEAGGELYYIAPDGAQHIAGGVYACLSSDKGGNAAYITYFGESDICSLYLYDGKTGESRCIDESAWASTSIWYNHAAISPDGRSLVYCRYSETSGPEGMLWTNGKYSSLGDALPIAVADSAEYIYYARTGNTEYKGHSYRDYYVLTKSGEVCISHKPVSGTFYFNRNFSEALVSAYNDEGNYSYFCIGGQATQTAETIHHINSIAAPGGELAGEYSWWDLNKLPRPEYYTRYGIDSFRGKTLLIETSEGWCGNSYVYPVYYVDNELRVHGPYDYNGSNFTMNHSGALYRYGHGLYYIENYPEDEPAQIGQTNIAALGSPGQVYYMSASGLCLWENGSVKTVAEDGRLIFNVRSASQDRSTATRFSVSLTYLPAVDGYLYFETGNNELRCLTPEGTIETLLTDVPDIQSQYFDGTPILTVRTGNGRVDLYRLDGATATLIAKDVAG